MRLFLPTIHRRCQLLLAEWTHRLRAPHYASTGCDRSLEYCELESRILMSASPAAAVVAEAPEAQPESSSITTTPAASEGSNETDESSSAVQSQSLTDESETHTTVELVVIDPSAQDYEELVADLLGQDDRAFEILVLDSTADGIDQITDALNELNDISAIHLVSHGRSGEVHLGNTVLSQQTLNGYASQLALWQDSLTGDADLLIYGCDLAASDDGIELTESLSVLLGTDVAASIDDTGQAALGGDWDLEAGVGTIETAVAFTSELQETWSGLLTLNAYESFSYSAGSLDGQNGGTGWATGWNLESGNTAQVNASGLTSPTGLPPAQGGTLEMNTGLTSFKQSRDLVATLGADGTTAWFSFLMQPDNVSFGGISLEIGDETGSDNTVNIGNNGNDFLLGIDGTPTGDTIDNAVVSGQTYFIVVQIDFAAGNDTVTLYVDPTAGVSAPDSLPAMTAQITTADLGTFSRVGVIGGFSGNDARIDEIRVGDTFQDVAGGNSVTLSAVGDTYIDKSNKSDNYGTSTSIQVNKGGGSIGDERALLQFDLSTIPAGATITGATLRLQATSVSGSFDINVYEITQAWDEGTGNGGADAANWDDRQDGVEWTTSGGGSNDGGTFDSTIHDTFNATTTGTHTWDISALVQDWVDGSKTNNGVILGSPDSGNETVIYDSSEGTTPPELVITYTVPANTAPTVSLANTISLPEDADTTASVKVADIVITDDGQGTNTLALTGTDAASFVIVNGDELHLAAGTSLDYETKQTYDVTVTVDDTTVGAGIDDTAAFTLNITDINDNTPVITSSQSFNVSEAATNGTSLGTVAATDDDTGTTFSGWTITGGNTDNIFAINAATGEITVADNTNLDFETTTSYTLSLTVSDGTNTSAVETVAISIDDTNDNAPVVTASQAFNVSETAINGTSLGTVAATDNDAGTVFSNWTITNGNADGVFGINTTTGELTVVDNTNLDFATTSSYTLTVTVSDGTNTSIAQTVAITVIQGNQTPVATDDSYSLNEGGTLAESVVAGWYNASWKTRQQLTFDNTAQASHLVNHAVLVRLHASAADAVNIDYSTTQDAGEDLRFVDGDGTLLAHEIEEWDESGYSYVWVEVPQIDAGVATDFIWMYYDHPAAADGQSVAAVWRSDDVAVLHMNGTVGDSSGQGNDGGQVNVATATGITAGAGSFNGANSYVTLGSDNSLDNVFDGGGTISAWINADTWGENGYGRIADKATTTFGGAGNGDGWAFQVGPNGKLIFEHGFSVAAGGWRTNDGVLSLNTWHHVAIVYDSSGAGNDPQFYVDGVLQTTNETDTPVGTFRSDAAVDLIVGNHAQVTSRTFDGRIDEFRVSTNAATADELAANVAATNGTFVSGRAAQAGPGGVLQNDSDPDGDPLTVTLVSGPANASSFTLNADGSFTYVHDGSETTGDSFTYQISDGTTTQNATATLSITAVNDNTPVITGGQSFNVSEAATNGTSLGTVTATDVDAGTTFSSWTITGGNTDNIFAINAATGEITVTDNSNLDFETTTSYTLSLTVSDGTNTSASQTVDIDVTNVSDSAPIITAGQSFDVNEAAGNGTPVGVVVATDVDTGTTFSNWTITGGNTDNIFAINAATGEITVADNTNLDFETTTSYTLSLTVSDGTLTSAIETVVINVTAANDNAPVITGGQTYNVSEGAANGTSLGTVAATDADAGTTFSNWTITGGNADGIFAINSASGEITVTHNSNLDFETTNSYTLSLTVSDGTNTSAVQTIAINVLDGGDSVGNLSDNDGTVNSVAEDAGIGTTVGITAFAADTDAGDSVSYSLDNDADGRFAVDSVTGVVTVAGALDFESNSSHTIVVRATSTDTSFSTKSFTIGLTDVNDNAPVIAGGQSFLVLDTIGIGAPVGTVTASDADTVGSINGWTIAGGNADGVFAIHPSTGVITIADDTLLDSSVTPQYTLLLQVGDGINTSAAQTITISSTPGAPAPPESGSGDESSSSDSGADASSDSGAGSGDSGNLPGGSDDDSDSDETDKDGFAAWSASTKSDDEKAAALQLLLPDEQDDESFLLTTGGTIDIVDSGRVETTGLEYGGRGSGDQTDLRELQEEATLSLAKLQQQFYAQLSTDHGLFTERLDALKDSVADELDLDRTIVGSVTAVSSGLAVGSVIWAVRGGLLLSGLLAQMPMWTMFDPLLVVDGVTGDDEDDESIHDIVDNQNLAKDQQSVDEPHTKRVPQS